MAKTLLTKHSRQFSESFDENKKKLSDHGVLKNDKSERNKLAGEISKQMRKAKKKKKDN